MQISRFFEIVYLLLSKKKMTANELAEHFAVSVRTILRDVEAISLAGIPIYASQGKGGGISLSDNYVLNKIAISDDEQKQILFALQSFSTVEHHNVNDILSKLRIFFDKQESSWIEVDFSRWGNSESDKAKFELLKNSILKMRAISFSYPKSTGEIESRTVYPLKLVFKSKAWYLQSYCLMKSDYRTFKINRMFSINALPDTFADKVFSTPPIETPAPPDAFVRLKLKFSPDAANRIYDEFDAQDIENQDDGSFIVSASIIDCNWLYSFLLSFGTTVQIIEPEKVKLNLLLQIEKMKKNLQDII